MVMIKVLHMVVATLILLALVMHLVQFVSGKTTSNLRPTAMDKVLRIAPHLLYTVLLITGGWMLMLIVRATGSAPYWIIAKIVLFVVAVSAGIKMTRAGATRDQQKAGLIVAVLAYLCIILLVVLKPTLSSPAAVNTTPVTGLVQ